MSNMGKVLIAILVVFSEEALKRVPSFNSSRRPQFGCLSHVHEPSGRSFLSNIYTIYLMYKGTYFRQVHLWIHIKDIDCASKQLLLFLSTKWNFLCDFCGVSKLTKLKKIKELANIDGPDSHLGTIEGL